MLESKKLELRRSEIRQELATLAAKPEPTEDDVRSMESLDKEFRTAETRYRAALVAEDEERREAGGELENPKRPGMGRYAGPLRGAPSRCGA